MTDTHSHLNSDLLCGAYRQWLDRAEAVGVHTVFVPGWNLESSRSAVHLAESDSRLRAIVGIHPSDCARWDSDTRREIADLANHPSVVAIGEIGLDTFRGATNLDEQERVCREQVALAKEAGLPVVLHCRPSADTMFLVDTLLDWLVADHAADGAIWHCFGGDVQQASRIAASGGFFGFDGPITYKKNGPLREVAASVPHDRLLLETDAPWLSPEPFRGRHPNVPERLPAVAHALAQAIGVSFEQLGVLADANTRRAFPKWKSGNTTASVAI